MSFSDLGGAVRQLPGLSHRPSFPKGLQVLLLDSDFKAKQEVEAQLSGCGYLVAACSSSAEAAAYLSNPDTHIDVLLVDVKGLQLKTAENAALIQAAKAVPLVLMSEASEPNEVMLGIKLGAVDFMEKPLSPLKLKNIWQHVVRRLMASNPGSSQMALMASCSDGALANKSTLAASPEHSCNGSHGSGGESGSNASTSDRAQVKPEPDVDMETSSLHVAGDASRDALHQATTPPCSQSNGNEPMQVEVVVDFRITAKPRPRPQVFKASRTTTPVLTGAVNAKPCLGMPAGQMPQLPNVTGMEWGLPTNPLQISPKAAGGVMGPMGSLSWPMAGMGSMMSGGLFPMLCSPSASLVSAASMPSMACPSPSPTAANASMKRSDSAPLPSNIYNGSPMSFDGFMMPPPPRQEPKLDLFSGIDLGRTCKPPIGLQLKKSPSLLDFISQGLKAGDGSAAS